ncbi:hypothetical protein Sjap_007335 [Stephania japonica]|uniref:Uncharacterized protein n=1 Tax=Stephania japonica TaxID=461633 RepID=A0AAP0JND9_9MAGN
MMGNERGIRTMIVVLESGRCVTSADSLDIFRTDVLICTRTSRMTISFRPLRTCT